MLRLPGGVWTTGHAILKNYSKIGEISSELIEISSKLVEISSELVQFFSKLVFTIPKQLNTRSFKEYIITEFRTLISYIIQKIHIL